MATVLVVDDEADILELIRVNRVARTSMPSIYAAGDCSDFLPLASVASMQGRTAVYHAMGDDVAPTELRNVAPKGE